MPPKRKPLPRKTRAISARTSPPKTRSATAPSRTQQSQRAEGKETRSQKSSKEVSTSIKRSKVPKPSNASKDSTSLVSKIKKGKAPERVRSSPTKLQKGAPKKIQGRKASKPTAPSAIIESRPPQSSEEILRTIETTSFDQQPLSHFDSDQTTSTASLPWSAGPQSREQEWYRRRGYLPALDDKTLEIIRIGLGKEFALKMARIRADESRFGSRLSEDRNVQLESSSGSDPYIDKLNKISLDLPEDKATTDVHSRLWTADVNHCKGEHEAMFQRTVMMAFIDRCRLIFGDIGESVTRDSQTQMKVGQKLAFSVEAEWTCDPMPTRGELRKDGELVFLAAPKPDLCVSFRRSEIINKGFWDNMPSTMKGLVCYEGVDLPHNRRAFGFLVAEAKRSRFSADDDVAKRQVLNDASQALHNMFEFFRQAEQESIFFEQVRFFSATTSEKGVIIRVHRAVRLDPSNYSLKSSWPIDVEPPYDLEFQLEEYATILNENFSRQNVVNMFINIMIGYGEGTLHKLIENAAKAIEERFNACRGKGEPLSSIINDYRHGQTAVPRKTRTPSVQGNPTTAQQGKQIRRGKKGGSTLRHQTIENSVTPLHESSNGQSALTAAAIPGNAPSHNFEDYSADVATVSKSDRSPKRAKRTND